MDGLTNSMDMSFGKLRDLVMDREAWCDVIHRVRKSQMQLSDGTEKHMENAAIRFLILFPTKTE